MAGIRRGSGSRPRKPLKGPLRRPGEDCSRLWTRRPGDVPGAAATLSAMASQVQIKVGNVAIGGGAPRCRPVDDADADPRCRGDDGADRGARERRLRDRPLRRSENRGRRGARPDRSPQPTPGDRGHPLQREPRAQGDRRRCGGGPDQPRQHRRPGEGRAGRDGCEAGGNPDADRRQLGLAAEAPARARADRPGRGARRGRARGGRAAREARLPRLQDLGQVDPRADDDPRLPDACRQGAVPAPSRGDRGRDAVLRLDQERGRDGRAARGRDRRHAPRLPHRRPGQGGRDGLGDPEGARPARARPGDDLVPLAAAATTWASRSSRSSSRSG